MRSKLTDIKEDNLKQKKEKLKSRIPVKIVNYSKLLISLALEGSFVNTVQILAFVL